MGTCSPSRTFHVRNSKLLYSSLPHADTVSFRVVLPTAERFNQSLLSHLCVQLVSSLPSRPSTLPSPFLTPFSFAIFPFSLEDLYCRLAYTDINHFGPGFFRVHIRSFTNLGRSTTIAATVPTRPSLSLRIRLRDFSSSFPRTSLSIGEEASIPTARRPTSTSTPTPTIDLHDCESQSTRRELASSFR